MFKKIVKTSSNLFHSSPASHFQKLRRNSSLTCFRHSGTTSSRKENAWERRPSGGPFPTSSCIQKSLQIPSSTPSKNSASQCLFSPQRFLQFSRPGGFQPRFGLPGRAHLDLTTLGALFERQQCTVTEEVVQAMAELNDPKASGPGYDPPVGGEREERCQES